MRLIHEIRASTIIYNLIRADLSAGRWLLPANVGPSVPLTFMKAGRPFEFVDIESGSLCMDRQEALRRLEGGRYSGLLFVHTYGVEDSFHEFFADIKRAAPGAILVDDRCLCRPNVDRPVSSHADVELYSTGYAKHVDVGQGGFAWLRDDLAYQQNELAYDQADLDELTLLYKAAIAGRKPLRYSDCRWLDSATPPLPLAEYCALIARRRAEMADHKEGINEIYRSELPESICLDERFQNWRFQILVPDKERLLAALFDNGLFASSHYADLTGIFSSGESLVAASFHEQVVNLFNDRYYSEPQAEQTARLVLNHLAGRH